MTSEKIFLVDCDGCGKKFDASHYEDIKTRHPHFNLILDGILGRDRLFWAKGKDTRKTEGLFCVKLTPEELELFKTILDSLEEDGDYQLEARDFDTLFDLCMKFRLLREDSLKKP